MTESQLKWKGDIFGSCSWESKGRDGSKQDLGVQVILGPAMFLFLGSWLSLHIDLFLPYFKWLSPLWQAIWHFTLYFLTAFILRKKIIKNSSCQKVADIILIDAPWFPCSSSNPLNMPLKWNTPVPMRHVTVYGNR